MSGTRRCGASRHGPTYRSVNPWYIGALVVCAQGACGTRAFNKTQHAERGFVWSGAFHGGDLCDGGNPSTHTQVAP